MGAYNFFKQRGLGIAMIIGLVVSVLMYVTLVGGQPPANSDREVHYASGAYDFSLYISYIFSILSGILLLGFFILQVARDPKKGLPGLILGVGVIVLYFIFSAMGDATLTPEAIKMELSPSRVQSIDAWLYLTYLFSFAAMIVWVGMMVYGAVKNR